MPIPQTEVGFCGNTKCERIQAAMTPCRDPFCSKKNPHAHCPECEELLSLPTKSHRQGKFTPKQRGSLFDCIDLTMCQVNDTEQDMAKHGLLDPDSVCYRFWLVHENLRAAVAQLNKVHKAAEAGDCRAVLRALDRDQIEFGHPR